MRTGQYAAFWLLSATVFIEAVLLVGRKQEKPPEQIAQYYKLEKDEQKSWSEKVVDDPIAFFTFVLTAFTGGLFLATRSLYSSTKDLVEGAEINARRQLRAYLFVQDVMFLPFKEADNPKESVLAYITFKNFGQTPAYEVSIQINFQYVAQNFGYVKGNLRKITENATVAPSDIQQVMNNEMLVTNHIWQHNKETNINMIAFGRVDYVDAFHESHWFEFHFFHEFGTSLNFMQSAVGNRTSWAGKKDIPLFHRRVS